MTQYLSYAAPGSTVVRRTVSAGSARDLQVLAAAAVAQLITGGADNLVSAVLACSGDGGQCSLSLEGVPTAGVGANYYLGAAAVFPLPLADVVINLFEAGHPRDVEAARTLALASLVGHLVVSTELAGASKGTKVMGAIIALQGQQ
ncbi:MAG: hypothetical protein WC803_13540 [Sphingomonas sp.]|jgi:hypothetical protein